MLYGVTFELSVTGMCGGEKKELFLTRFIFALIDDLLCCIFDILFSSALCAMVSNFIDRWATMKACVFITHSSHRNMLSVQY